MNKFYTLLCLILLAICTQTEGQIYYVKAGASGNGTSWADASGNLQAVLANASSGSQVWVAKGIYTPANCSPCNTSDRNISFEIPNGVALYGGFQGTESTLAERNWQANSTILSADIDSDGTATNNSFSIIYTAYVNNQTLADGFIIEGGNADDNSVSYGERNNSGAGWYNTGKSSGGTSHPTVRNCIFRNNYAVGFGGAMFHQAAFSGSCHPNIINCTFETNSSKSGGGGVYFNAILGGQSYPQLVHCTFQGNSCENSGGAMYNNGQLGSCNPTIINCLFLENETNQYGAGMYNLGKSGDASPKLTNCIFYDNSAVAAGAIYNLGSENGNSSPVITNCTFFKNSANVGGVMYNQANDATGNCEAVVQNCIFWANTAGYGLVFQNGYAHPSISYSLVQVSDCSQLNTGTASTVNCGAGMLFGQSPVFADSANYDLRLQSSSLAVDAGSNPAILATGIGVDFDSLPRIFNGTVDLGAFEFGSTAYDPPQIITQAASANLCEGQQISLQISANGTPPLQYQWYKDGRAVSGATSPVLQINNAAISDAGAYHCTVISTMADTATSQIANVQVFENLSSAIDIATTTEAICAGSDVSFSTSISNGGSTPQYQWYINGSAVAGANNSTFVYSGFANGDVVQCELTSNAVCVVNPVEVSNEVEISVANWVEPAITINASASEVCEGTNVQFTAQTEFEGTSPIYRWFINSVEVAETNTPVFNSTTLANGDLIHCILESNHNCISSNSVMSNQLNVSVLDLVKSSVSLSATMTELCEGEELIISAQVVHGGTSPLFDWYVNGQLQPKHAPSLSSSDFANQTQVYCVLTSNAPCVNNNIAYSDTLAFRVADMVVAEVLIEADKDTLCEGEEVKIKALSSNSGVNPHYQWKLNGMLLSVDSSEISLIDLADGDRISCEMTSSSECVENNPVQSNELSLIVHPMLEASARLYIMPGKICVGDTVLLQVDANNPGDAPVFQWFWNDQPVGANSPSFRAEAVQNNDQFYCRMTSSDACAVPSTVFSDTILLPADDCTTSLQERSNEPFWKLFPNPSGGRVFVTSTSTASDQLLNYQIFNAQNGAVAKGNLNPQEGINLEALASGCYWIVLQHKERQQVERLIIIR